MTVAWSGSNRRSSSSSSSAAAGDGRSGRERRGPNEEDGCEPENVDVGDNVEAAQEATLRASTPPPLQRPSSWSAAKARRSKSTGSNQVSSSSFLPTTSRPFRRFSVEVSTEALFRNSHSDLSGLVSFAGKDKQAIEEIQSDGVVRRDTGGVGGLLDLHGQDDNNDGAALSSSSSSSSSAMFYGAYADIRRSRIDYSYHVPYRKERQWLHDSIIVDLLEGGGDDNVGGGGESSPPPGERNDLGRRHDSRDSDGGDDDLDDNSSTSSSSSVQIMECAARHFQPHGQGDEADASAGGCEGPKTKADLCHPWFILTAGPQGAGKRYTVEQLVKRGMWSFSPLVVVDTDEIRRSLPEYATYVEQVPDHADRLTGKEAGYIGETMLWAALRESKTVVLDSCLKDGAWYAHLVQHVRAEHPHYKVALLHVSCPDDQVLCERAHRRSRETGREISLDTIREQLACLPRSMETVAPVVDQCFDVCNNTDLCLLNGTTWDDFTNAFRSSRESEECQRQQIRSPNTCSSHKRRSFRRFSILRSSEENHRSDDRNFYGKYAHLRKTLDYTYHCNYTFERQMFQDAVIDHFLKAAVIMDKNGELCTTPTEPWIVFTAGAMGAGKSHTMRILVENGLFPLLAFVNVDPDRIRYFIPEFHIYLEQNAELAGELTRKEAGFIAEILALAGLHAGKNVLVDGSLRDHGWYKEYFSRLRTDFPGLRIAILHVTAPSEAVFQRAEERALVTGRVVPRKLIAEALEQVPRSVHILAPLVDYQVELNNSSDDGNIELVTEGETWETFKSHWIQTCAWLPSQRLKKKLSKRAESSSVSLHSSESSYNKT